MIHFLSTDRIDLMIHSSLTIPLHMQALATRTLVFLMEILTGADGIDRIDGTIGIDGTIHTLDGAIPTGDLRTAMAIMDSMEVHLATTVVLHSVVTRSSMLTTTITM